MTVTAETRRPPATALAFLPLYLLQLFDGFFKKQAFESNPLLFWAFDVAKFVALPALCLWLLARFGRWRPADYGLRRDRMDYEKLFVELCLLTLLLWGVYNGASHLAWDLSGLKPPAFDYGSTVPKGMAGVAVAIYYGLTAGIVEEIYYRGLLYASLGAPASRTGIAGYLLFSSLLFASVHWEDGMPELVATFCYGVAAALCYLKLRHLWSLIGAHAIIDIIEFWPA